MFSIFRRPYPRAMTIFAMAVFVSLSPGSLQAAETISFSEDIAPIIQIRCLECHKPGGEGFIKSGFDLSTYEGVMKGTKFGAMVIPGNAFMSNLMVMIDGRIAPEFRMPHNKKKLSICEQKLFRRWINQGAKDN